MAGPTPLSTVSSDTALETSGSDWNAFSDADFTAASSKDETKSNKRGLKKKKQNSHIIDYTLNKVQEERERERERERVPPFATCELPLHEFGELGGGDVRVRVSVAKNRRELVAVKVVKGN